MNQFVVLSSDKHSQLRLKKNAGMAYAAIQQALPLEAVEVSKAVTQFPVFFTRNQHGEMTLSAIAGLNQSESLFVKDGQWDAAYLPTCLQTYPFYLIKSPDDESQYTVGIQETDPSFSVESGDRLFDDEGHPSESLDRASQLLNKELNNIQATVKMVDVLTKLDLFKPIDVIVQYADNTSKKINGLYTIDEDKLSTLGADDLMNLNKEGFLVIMHALLISIYQLNSLIRRHNNSNAQDKIINLKMEIPRDTSGVQ